MAPLQLRIAKPEPRPRTPGFSSEGVGATVVWGQGSHRNVITQRGTGGLALIAILLSCGGGQKFEGTFDIKLPQPEVVVSTESELLGNPSDIALDSEGRIWIADPPNRRVVLLDHEGRMIRTIGRGGDGPGEFQWPAKVAVNDTVVRVWDPMRITVQDYRPDGTHLADHSISVSRTSPAAALSIEGPLVIPTFGGDSALAVLHTVGSSATTRLGPLVVPEPVTGDLFALSNAIKAEARQGRVPTQVRNMAVTPATGTDGTVWLLVQTEHEVRKYSQDGTLLWQRVLEVPEVESTFREFFRRTIELEPNAPAFPPIMLDAAREIGGTLWILMHGEAGHPSVFYLLDSRSGRVQGRLTVAVSAPARGFNVDTARKLLYLAIPEEAALLGVDLRSTTGLSWE